MVRNSLCLVQEASIALPFDEDKADKLVSFSGYLLRKLPNYSQPNSATLAIALLIQRGYPVEKYLYADERVGRDSCKNGPKVS